MDEYRPIIAGVVIGLIVGGLFVYLATPTHNHITYEEHVAQLESQITSLQNENSQLQSQVTSLKNQLENTEVTIDRLKMQLKNKEEIIDEIQAQINILMKTFNYSMGVWDVLKTWNGSASKTTELFYVPSNQIRIRWSLDTNQFSYFTISLFRESTNYSIISWSSLEEEPEGETYSYVAPGYYYLNFSVNDCKYNVIVEASIDYLKINIFPRKAEFEVGEVLAFSIESNSPLNDSYFKVWDSKGDLIWRTDYLSEWIKISDYWTVPFVHQLSNGEPMTLRDNCTLGTWRWIWYNEFGLVSGTFEVVQGKQHGGISEINPG